jgi:hypothetical protein
MTKDEILVELKKNTAGVIYFIDSHHIEELKLSKAEKWNSVQHLEHLLRSIQPLNKALRIPVPGLRVLFGKRNRPERSYHEVVKKYKDNLEAGGKASGRYIPQKNSSINKLKNKYREQSDSLMGIIEKWKEEDMSTCLLPHPLLGKLTIREMLYFTVYHTQHHLQLMEANLAT